MVYTWIDAVIATAIAVVSITAALALDGRQRRRRLAARQEMREAGSGPYGPLHEVPRNVDLAIAIAEHLRLKYRPIIYAWQAVDDALRVSLRAATLLAREIPTRTE